MCWRLLYHTGTVKPVLNGHAKIDKTQILMTNNSLLKVESIAECSAWNIMQYFWPSKGSILQYFWLALRDNWSWKPIFCLLESGHFTQVLLSKQYIKTCLNIVGTIPEGDLCTNTERLRNLVFGVCLAGLDQMTSSELAGDQMKCR